MELSQNSRPDSSNPCLVDHSSRYTARLDRKNWRGTEELHKLVYIKDLFNLMYIRVTQTHVIEDFFYPMYRRVT